MALCDVQATDVRATGRRQNAHFSKRRLAAVLVCCLIAPVAYWVMHFTWGGNLHTVVAGRVYRSAQPTPAMLADVQDRYGVKSVINLRGDWPDEEWFQVEQRATDELGLQRYDVWLRTHRLAPMSEVRKLVAALDSCPKPVLIHCRQGADRASLASAIYMVLHEGQSPEEARSQYALWYGHIGYAHGWQLPHLFDCYRDWLAEQSIRHSPAEFRRWVSREATVGYFGASLTTAAPVQTAVAGQGSLVYQVKNTSRYPWVFDDPATDAVHLRVRFTHHASGKRVYIRTPGPRGTVQPGQTVQIEMTVPAELTEPGLYGVFADMEDLNGISFSDMCPGGCPCDLAVVHPATGPDRQHGESPSEIAGRETGKQRR